MNKVSSSIKSVKDTAKVNISAARTKTDATAKSAKQKAARAYDKSIDVASRGVQNSKQYASKAAAKSADSIDKNPLALVVGGIALGAILGALLPRSDKEEKLLGKAGSKLNKKAREVTLAAKDAGREKIENLGINKDNAREQFRDLVSKASQAVVAAGKAASNAVRNQD
jgi:ElaB/YqjD/DUF883 family membrane-anchored ribosome-binding protein